MPTLSITNPPDGSQAGLVSVEIFAYIGFVVILLTDSNKHRTVALFGFLGDLIPGAASVHRRLVAAHFVVVDLELLLMGQAAIVLCANTSVCRMQAAFTRFIHFTSLGSARSERMLFSER